MCALPPRNCNNSKEGTNPICALSLKAFIYARVGSVCLALDFKWKLLWVTRKIHATHHFQCLTVAGEHWLELGRLTWPSFCKYFSEYIHSLLNVFCSLKGPHNTDVEMWKQRMQEVLMRRMLRWGSEWDELLIKDTKHWNLSEYVGSFLVSNTNILGAETWIIPIPY